MLLDIQMPVMDGYEAAKRIRANPDWAELPVLAMTASAMDHQRQECLDAGMNDHIAKPIEVDHAMDTMNHWMKPLEQGERPEAESPPPKEPAVPAVPVPPSGELDIHALPGFDIPAAMTRVNNDEALLRRLLLSFADTNADLVARVRATLDAGDEAETFGLVHAVKGSAGNLGSIDLFAAAKDFQAALERKESDTYEDHFQVFQARLCDTLAALGKQVSSTAPSADSAPATISKPLEGAERQQVLDDLNELVELMAGRNMRSVDLSTEIKERMAGGPFDDDIGALESALIVLDFATGQTLAEELIGKIDEAG